MNNDTLILLSVLEDYKDKYSLGKLLKIIVAWVNCQLIQDADCSNMKIENKNI